MKTKSIFTVILFIGYAGCAWAQTAADILKKTDEVMYAAKDQKATVTIILKDKKGNLQERQATYIQKGSEMRLFKFTAPASQAGIAFLSLPQDVMYLYLPAYEKERRIASHVKNQTFAGTDFSYDDMESRPLSDEYQPELVASGGETWKLRLTPKNPEGSDYSRMEVSIRKDNYYLAGADYYDRGGQKIKQLVNHKIEKVDGYWAATEMEMTDLVRGHSTAFISSGLSFDNQLKEEDFSIRAMKQ